MLCLSYKMLFRKRYFWLPRVAECPFSCCRLLNTVCWGLWMMIMMMLWWQWWWCCCSCCCWRCCCGGNCKYVCCCCCCCFQQSYEPILFSHYINCVLYTVHHTLEPATEHMKSRQISNPLARWWQWQQRGSRTRNETSEGGRVVKN